MLCGGLVDAERQIDDDEQGCQLYCPNLRRRPGRM
jgi:hypothetical protein